MSILSPQCVRAPKEIVYPRTFRNDPVVEQLQQEYLRYVDIPDVSENFKISLIDRVVDAVNEYINVVRSLHFNEPDMGGAKPRWDKCDAAIDREETALKCEPVMNKVFNKELGSTAYMLRTISASAIFAHSGSVPRKVRFRLLTRESMFTGIWEDDQTKIALDDYNLNDAPSTCIMGFGPSASGKTHWAKTIIDMLYDKYVGKFPNRFFSIDGGIFRDTSELYGALGDSPYHVLSRINLQSHEESCPHSMWRGGMVSFGIAHLGKGFTDLIKGVGKSMFQSNKIKKAMEKFFAQSVDSRISLYVPITLGNCMSSALGIADCNGKYKKYIRLAHAKTNWIGLMIYMHRDTCPLDDEYKCETCVKSGRKRELSEGKKYNSGAWQLSYYNGITQIKKAPRGRYVIHNSGSPNRLSIIDDLSQNSADFLPVNEKLYILRRK